MSNGVKEARKALGYSQSMFARALGVHINTLRSWEYGKHQPSAQSINRILLLRSKMIRGEKPEVKLG